MLGRRPCTVLEVNVIGHDSRRKIPTLATPRVDVRDIAGSGCLKTLGDILRIGINV